MRIITKKNKKADFTLKSGKFFLAQQQGMKDSEASKIAGISKTNITNIENTDNYKLCVETFKDNLLSQITIRELTAELLKNIRQDTDKGAKNTAIKIAIDKVEPENNQQQAQQVNIVLEAPK
jgi:hypothetical protein